MKKVDSIKDAILLVLSENPELSKYRLAKELNLSSATHINNYITGATKKTRIPVMKALYDKYGVLVENYENSPEYRRTLIKDIKV